MATPWETARLEDVPWCTALIGAPNTVTFVPPSYATKDDVEPPLLDQLFRRVLRNNEAIPRCLGFYQDPIDLSDGAVSGLPFLLTSSSLIFDLRPGVNGFNGTAHGGLIVALMDESMGAYLIMNDKVHKQKKAEGLLPPSSKGFESMGFVTGRMDTRLLKPIHTPQIVVVTSHLAEVDGRKVHFRVAVTGEQGEVYATCDGTWVSFLRGKL
ncbi:HotDog domain-containing protein [Truncatella angustata]|uniref:HotDog domain-containing protein n=1 Tax=Truncatella angustata TaxID=152316 RepID=A0A9P8UDS4_9PEZI|nr:HotDog domain-containing protein [Truncatella angustata]KAH6648065.1 HotDog domain-containing protein [Truncatella angustata]